MENDIHDRSTAPPPQGTFIRIVVVNEHNPSQGEAVARFIGGKQYLWQRSTVERCDALPLRPNPSPFDIVIIALDEFTDLDERLDQVRIVYGDNALIIVHLTAERAVDEGAFADHDVLGAFEAYDYNTLTELLQQAAKLMADEDSEIKIVRD